MELTTSPARLSSRLRASSTTWQCSATTFAAVPPSIWPMFAVVPASRRPIRMAASACAAAAMALRPVSGRMPAWAAAAERLAPRQGEFLAGGEEELHADGGPRRHQPPGCAEDGGHGGLVVRAEDGLVPVGEDAVLARHLHRGGERDRVEVGAEEDGAGALRARYAGEQVAGLRARVPAAVVFLDLEAELCELGADGLRYFALAPRGTLDLAEADEVVQQALALLRGGGSHGAERYRGRVPVRATGSASYEQRELRATKGGTVAFWCSYGTPRCDSRHRPPLLASVSWRSSSPGGRRSPGACAATTSSTAQRQAR